MHVAPIDWNRSRGWHRRGIAGRPPQLVLYFGDADELRDGEAYRSLRGCFPGALLAGCSSYGYIRRGEVADGGVIGTAVSFERTRVRMAAVTLDQFAQSRACGAALARELAAEDLAAVIVLSDGLTVNGSELIDGLVEAVGPGVPVSGGLAADGARFAETLVGIDNEPRPHQIGAVGFYGKSFRIGHGTGGGWDTFGPHRRVTRAEGNILYELDGKPALDLYERYLGDEADGLPGTGLLYPLKIWDPADPRHDVVRAVLAVDREARSMGFGGDVPAGWVAQLMRGSIDHLAAGAEEAAQMALASLPGDCRGDTLALLVSCIGRRLLMEQRTAEEVEIASAVLRSSAGLLGFYSYGEIAPHPGSGQCGLFNQTMTITIFGEAGG